MINVKFDTGSGLLRGEKSNTGMAAQREGLPVTKE